MKNKRVEEYIYPNRKELMETTADTLVAAFDLAHVSQEARATFMDELKVMVLAG